MKTSLAHELAGSAARVSWIALGTFREAMRQRFFLALLALVIGLVASQRLFVEMNFGASLVKFIADFGFGALAFFGSILAVVVTAHLFFSEIENRTAQTLLAKPVGRGEFLAGKGLGAWALLGVYCAIVTAAIVGPLAGMEPAGADLLLAGALQWLKLGVMVAFTLLVATYAQSSLFTIGLGLMLLVAFQLQHLAGEAAGQMEPGLVRGIWQTIAVGLPDFQVFDVYDAIGAPKAPGIGFFWRAAGYGTAYIVAAGWLATYSFRRREF